MRGRREVAARVGVALVTALAWALVAAAERADSLARGKSQGVADFLDELVDVEVTLVLPARVAASRSISGSLRVENKGPVTCVVPLDLRPGGGAARVDWSAPDGTGSRGRLRQDRRVPTVALAPGAFYGQRIDLTAVESEPCGGVGDPKACDWQPGRHVFTATLEIGIDPAARPSEDTLPGLASRAFTTAPVTVEVVPR
jgi:hypothetical protein